MGGEHGRTDDSVDMDQTPGSDSVDSHDYVEHKDGSIDADEGYEG